MYQINFDGQFFVLDSYAQKDNENPTIFFLNYLCVTIAQ